MLSVLIDTGAILVAMQARGLEITFYGIHDLTLLPCLLAVQAPNFDS